MTTTIRPLTIADGTAAAQVFFDAVHAGTADVYTKKQRNAWAGCTPNPDGWRNHFLGVQGYVAEVGDHMAGFMTIDQNGYIDLAFVRPDVMGRGVGRSLYQTVEAHARSQKMPQLTTEASLKAKPFFERMGWRVLCRQTVVKRTVPLTNFKMFKNL